MSNEIMQIEIKSFTSECRKNRDKPNLFKDSDLMNYLKLLSCICMLLRMISDSQLDSECITRPYLLPDVGAGGPEKPLDFRSQVSTHLSRTHTGQSAQSQRLHVLTAVRKVAAKEQTAINLKGKQVCGVT